MAKKAAKKPAKAVTKKAAKAASSPKTKKPAKAGVKSPAKKAATKPAKPVAKALSKPPGKSRAKVTKAAAVKKAPAAKTTTAKAPLNMAARPAPKPAPASKPAVEKIAPAPDVATEGAKAPAFQLPRDGGAEVSLSDYAGQKLVIFFYPRASTPGCTKEAIDFTRLSADFQAAGAAVLGVSADPLKAQESFRDKFALGVPLLSDATQKMLKSYGAWGEKSMYGKVFEGVLRTTVLIDTKGNVARIWRGVKVDGHADAVLEEARRI